MEAGRLYSLLHGSCQLHEIKFTSNVVVLEVRDLENLLEEPIATVKNQASLIAEYKKSKNKKAFEEKGSKLITDFLATNAQLRLRIDHLRASDPMKYFR